MLSTRCSARPPRTSRVMPPSREVRQIADPGDPFLRRPKASDDGYQFCGPSRLAFFRLFESLEPMFSGGTNMKHLLTRLWQEEEGQDLTEYALLLVLLSLAAVGTLDAL